MKTTIAKVLLVTLAVFFASIKLTTAANAQQIQWQSTNVATHNNTGKIVMLYVYAPWCGYCRQMSRTTLSNQEVISTVNANFTATRANIDTDTTLTNRFGVHSTPSIIFIDQHNHVIDKYLGYLTASELMSILHSLKH